MTKPDTIAIFVGATGQYADYLSKFIDSAEKYLFPKAKKRYIVFTDLKSHAFGENVIFVPTEHKQWPWFVMRKFELILAQETLWSDCDYCMLLNVNIEFKKTIPCDHILPDATQDMSCLTFEWHPTHNFPVERRPEYHCYIPKSVKLPAYWQSGFCVATSAVFKTLCTDIVPAMKEDRENGLTAVWHDESYLNHWLVGKKIKTISKNYCMPEGYSPWRSIKGSYAILRNKSYEEFGKYK